MRSLAASFARRPGAGAIVAFVLLTTSTTGCEFLKGRPDVKSVDVAVAPKTIAEGQSAQAQGTPRKGDGSAISSSKVHVTFSTSDPSIATINPNSGVIVGVAPGQVVITAESQGKTGSDTLRVVPADPTSVIVNPSLDLPLTVGQTGTITLDPRGPNGLTLPNRTATFQSSDSRIATVENSGPLAGKVTGVALGSANVSWTIGSITRSVSVLVRLTRPKSVVAQLQSGGTAIQVRESQQILLTLRDSSDKLLPSVGHALSYQSSDLTVATVNATTGVVTGVKEGTADISVTVDNFATGVVHLSVVPQKVVDLKFGAPNAVLRIGGATRAFVAQPIDSLLHAVDRPVAYKSLNDAVATVTGIGLITPRGLGTARIVASIDSYTDTLTVQVTPLPITSIRVDPTQATANIGETRQFTATLFDSLGTQVSGRPITWQSSNPNGATVSASGLATAREPSAVDIQAFVDVVPGFAPRIGQSARLIVSLAPISRIEVSPETVTLKVGQRSTVIVKAFDANGTELFNRGGSINVRASNPAVAAGDGSGAVVGITAGTTTLTYQAINGQTGLAEGAPATITVTVNQ